MTAYAITLTTLSPLHIGDGIEMHKDFHFAVYQGSTYRLDEDAILDKKYDQLAAVRASSFPPPGRLLKELDYRDTQLFRYTLKGEPRASGTDSILRSFIKDVFDRPYVPGSSLKGALRTALAWNGFQEVRIKLDRNAIGRHRSWAGQPLERRIFGPDPNHDLLRALHVSDMFGPQNPGERLMIVNAQVMTIKGQGSPIELEAVRGDTAFKGSLTVDETLFSPAAERELHFANRRSWIEPTTMLARVNKHSRARIEKLADWFERAEGGQDIAKFYRQLGQAALTPRQAILQVGWGAGWDAKTLWTHLQADPYLFEKLVEEFRMTKRSRSGMPRRPGDPFPKSRRVVMRIQNRIASPYGPFGWVLLEIGK